MTRAFQVCQLSINNPMALLFRKVFKGLAILGYIEFVKIAYFLGRIRRIVKFSRAGTPHIASKSGYRPIRPLLIALRRGRYLTDCCRWQLNLLNCRLLNRLGTALDPKR